MLKVPILCLLFQAFFITPSAFVSPGNKVNALYSNKAKALYKEGMLCIKSGRLSAAEQCFSAAIRKDSGFTAAYLQLGNVYVLMHDLPAAKQQFRQVLQQAPTQPEALSSLANIFFEQQDYEDALNYAEQACQAGVSQMTRLKALCYYKQGQQKKAISILLEAQKETPADAGITYTLAGFYFNTKNFPAAVTAFELAAAKGYPANADFHLNTGTSYLQIKQTEIGIRHLEACLTLRPDDTQALQALAHNYYSSNNYGKAIIYWNRLLSLQPANAFARFMLGKSYIGNGESAKGEVLCDNALISN
ncbi:tetratricopeptide repeat protein [Chitinophaga sp. YR573]|uniref:tetratricopeptide repeat protein n=1 Tax=Chitinophaga sp. YR573 TaxID=1881040 RepID=UPI000B7E20D6|nr:tetratricopeptide repeat protein [Chitinophaga sp. YR573]